MKRLMMSISPSKVRVKFSLLEDFNKVWLFSGMAVFLKGYRRTVMMEPHGIELRKFGPIHD